MGNCECGRLKGNPCGPLRPNTISVTMPMAQQCDVERQPEAVLRAPARTDQIKIISGQKIVALQRSDVGENPK